MKRQKITQLKEIVAEALKVAKESAEKTKKDSDIVEKETASSWSSGGDRFHARAQAEITAKNVSNFKYLLEELEKDEEKEIPNVVKPVCIVTIKSTATSGEFAVVKNPVFLKSTLKLISPNSPLGKAIVGKSVGDKFSYNTNLGEVSGEVVDIG